MAESIPGPERRIILLGNVKRVMGNTILGSKVFECRKFFRSVRKSCQREEAQMKGMKIVVVDTPEFFNPYHPEKEIAAEVSKCVKFCSPGPHVILHMIQPSLLSQDETDVAQQIKEIFGLKAKDYTILLFTHKDYMKDGTFRNVIISTHEKLKEYIAEWGNRFVAFNKEAQGVEREAQVSELMTTIDDLVEKNKDAPCFTEDTKDTTSG